jgi:uncharacterized membrane protein
MIEQPALDERSIEFLTQECERLLSLYSEAQSGAQSVFNFYLTFLTTVIGAVVVIFQTGGDHPIRTQLIIAALLFFAAIVGTVYLSAISGRYAHAARYASAVDNIRRYLIRQQGLTVPRIYNDFLTDTAPQEHRIVSTVIWLFPTGTYQMFMTFVNSAALALMTLLIAAVFRADFTVSLVAAVLVALITLWIYNIYSRLVIRRFGSGINFDFTHTSSAWAARN